MGPAASRSLMTQQPLLVGTNSSPCRRNNITKPHRQLAPKKRRQHSMHTRPVAASAGLSRTIDGHTSLGDKDFLWPAGYEPTASNQPRVASGLCPLSCSSVICSPSSTLRFTSHPVAISSSWPSGLDFPRSMSRASMVFSSNTSITRTTTSPSLQKIRRLNAIGYGMTGKSSWKW
jgi:hypothetical protein